MKRWPAEWIGWALIAGCAAGTPDDGGSETEPEQRDARMIEDAGIPADRGVASKDAAAGDAHFDAAPDARTDTDADADADARPDARTDGAPPRDAIASDAFVSDAAPPDAAAGPCAPHEVLDLNALLAPDGFYDGDTRGAPAATLGSCGGGAGGERVFRYRLAQAAPQLVFATDHPETTAPTVLYVRDACDGAERACNRGAEAAPGTRVVLAAPAPGDYFVFVDTGNREGGGPFRLTVEQAVAPACADGRDNDGDGRIDLFDPGCPDGERDSEADPAVPPRCADGVDNDNDGVVDYPDDEDCAAAGDDGERDGSCDVLEVPCDGRNLGADFLDNSSAGGPWIGFNYVPDAARAVTRLEVFTGEVGGQSRLGLWTHDPRTQAPGVEIAGGDWPMQQANGWQGADLPEPVELVAGATYWVVWQPVPNSQTTFSGGGAPVQYRGSPDRGQSWNGPFEAPVKFRLFCCEGR